MLKNKIPPPVYGIAFIAAMYWLANNYPGMILIEAPVNKIAYAFAALGLFLDISALGLFVMSKTTVNPITPKNASTIVTKGMYRFSRNPMYLGLLFWLIAWAIHLSVLTPFLLLPLFVWVLTVQQIIPEEKILEEKFGDSYMNYKKQVGRWI